MKTDPGNQLRYQHLSMPPMRYSILSPLVLLATCSVMLHAQPLTVAPLNVNTARDDFASAITGNGRMMYLTSRAGGDQAIYYAEQSSSGWNQIVPIPELSQGDQDGTTTFTPDGQLMVFSSLDNPVDGAGRTDLYSAQRASGVWTNVQNLGTAVNSPYWDSHPCISSDGKTLYFASDRPGGMGKVDIYISRFISGRWSAPANAGTTVNTEHDDMCPVIAPDTRTLFFASNRPGGLGGFDLYTTKLSAGSFGDPRNLGTPINSGSDDYFYYALNTAERAYFSSNRPEGAGGIDIYIVTPNPFPSEAVVSVHGIVTDAKTGALLGSNIIITDLKTNQQVAKMRSDDLTGEYFATLVAGHIYSITAQKNGYLFYSERYEVSSTTTGQDIEKSIPLQPIAGGSTRLMVFFDFNKSSLLDESVSELERLIEFLKASPEVRISLEGHTDDVGSDTYNDDLSLRRANAVKTYLVDAGVDGSRMKTRGLGKRQPLVRETTEDARRNNRRVEMKVD